MVSRSEVKTGDVVSRQGGIIAFWGLGVWGCVDG